MSSNPLAERLPGRTAGWSLRARLVGTVIVLLALVCLLIGVVTEVALSRVLYDRMDRQLVAAASRSSNVLGPHRDGPPPGHPERPEFRIPPGQGAGAIGARIIDGKIEIALVLDRHGKERSLPTAALGVLKDVPADSRPHTYDLGELGDYRLIATEMPNGDVLITGLPLADVRFTLYTVAAVEAGIAVLALLLAGLIGAAMIRRELRPLDRVAATAGRVTQLRLDSGEVALAERVTEADTDPRTEVGQVGAAINRMLEHVAAALAARHASETQVRQFVADASHELRTPLAAIRGYAELARRRREPVPEELAHVLRRVESETERMTVLVEDLLLLARLDSGRPLAAEPVDLARVAVDAVSDAHAAGPEHHWRLDVPDEPVTVTGDPDRLHQVVANLLSNARTHTPPGSTVDVGVTRENDHAVLTVTDDGPGIPPELLPHIFERFGRGDSSRSRAAGSTGLGLAIVDAVVIAHGGRIDVASAPGRTRFTVHLPVAGSQPARSEHTPA